MLWIMCAAGVIFASMVVVLAFWPHRMRWWEFGCQIPLPVLACWGLASIGSCQAAADTEWRSGWVTEAQFDESWSEIRTRVIVVSNGKTTSTRVVTYVHVHPPVWRALLSGGGSRAIDAHVFWQLALRWNNQTAAPVPRSGPIVKHGGRIITRFPGDDALLEPYTVAVDYENRTQATPGLFRFGEFEVAGQPVVDRPARCGLAVPAFIGPLGVDEQHALTALNARTSEQPGAPRVVVVLFQGGTVATGQAQESHWKGGKRNELVVTVGLGPDRAVLWCWAFSWTPAQTLVAELRNRITAQTRLDLMPVLAWLREELPRSWRERDFAEYSYLVVPPPTWAIVLGLLLALAANVGLTYWLVVNEFHDDPHRPAPAQTAPRRDNWDDFFEHHWDALWRKTR